MEKKIATFGGNVATLLYNEMVNVKGRLNSRPFCVAMWSTGKDAQKPASAQLLPCLMCTGLRVGVAVGSLLHIEIVPCAGVRVVAPGLHAGKQVRDRLRRALQRTVDHGHHLCTGHGLIRAEGAVGIAVDPAELRADSDRIGCPVVRGDVGEVVRRALRVGELCQHRGKLCTRDCLIRTELAVRSGVDDHAGIFKRCNVEVEPVAAYNIAERASGRFIRLDTICVHDAIKRLENRSARGQISELTK